MTKPKQTVNYFFVGHRIHFNWPLLILLAWMSLIAYGAIFNKQEIVCPTAYVQQGEIE